LSFRQKPSVVPVKVGHRANLEFTSFSLSRPIKESASSLEA